MKRIPMILVFPVLIVLLLNPVFSQPTEDSSAVAAFHFPKQSFQFSVQGLLLLKDFQGAVLSFKYHFNDHLAWRVGIGMSGTSSYQKNERTELDSGVLLLLSKLNDDKFKTTTNLQLVYYFNPAREIKFYAGAGPYAIISFSGRNLKEPPIYRDTTRYQTENNYTKRYYEGGLSTVYGLEWFFKNNMSLSAEYGFRLGYQYQIAEMKNIYRTETTTINKVQVERKRNTVNAWKASASQVTMVLTIYF